MIRALVLATALVVIAPASAASPPPDTAQSSNASATFNGNAETVGEGSDKIICKREKVVGSRLAAKKICQTAAQWERQRREEQQLVEKVQSSRWKSD